MNFIEACKEVVEHPHRNPGSVLLQYLKKIEFDALLEHICVTASSI
jgi:hypothetical protein